MILFQYKIYRFQTTRRASFFQFRIRLLSKRDLTHRVWLFNNEIMRKIIFAITHRWYFIYQIYSRYTGRTAPCGDVAQRSAIDSTLWVQKRQRSPFTWTTFYRYCFASVQSDWPPERSLWKLASSGDIFVRRQSVLCGLKALRDIVPHSVWQKCGVVRHKKYRCFRKHLRRASHAGSTHAATFWLDQSQNIILFVRNWRKPFCALTNHRKLLIVEFAKKTDR
jgi:hypothetical protein